MLDCKAQLHDAEICRKTFNSPRRRVLHGEFLQYETRCPVFSRPPWDLRASLAKPSGALNKDFLANILPASQHAPRVYDDCAQKFHHDVIWAYLRPSPWNSDYEDSCLLCFAEVSLSRIMENSRCQERTRTRSTWRPKTLSGTDELDLGDAACVQRAIW